MQSDKFLWEYSFDLVEADLKVFYGKSSYKHGWDDVGNFLKANGFDNKDDKQGSCYFTSKRMTPQKANAIIRRTVLMPRPAWHSSRRYAVRCVRFCHRNNMTAYQFLCYNANENKFCKGGCGLRSKSRTGICGYIGFVARIFFRNITYYVVIFRKIGRIKKQPHSLVDIKNSHIFDRYSIKEGEKQNLLRYRPLKTINRKRHPAFRLFYIKQLYVIIKEGEV